MERGIVDCWLDPAGPGEIALSNPFRRVYVERRGLAAGVEALCRGDEVEFRIIQNGESELAVDVRPSPKGSAGWVREEPAQEFPLRAERFRRDAAEAYRAGERAARIDEATMQYTKAQYLISCALQLELQELASSLRAKNQSSDS